MIYGIFKDGVVHNTNVFKLMRFLGKITSSSSGLSQESIGEEPKMSVSPHSTQVRPSETTAQQFNEKSVYHQCIDK